LLLGARERGPIRRRTDSAARLFRTGVGGSVRLLEGSALKGSGSGVGAQQHHVRGREVAGGNAGDRLPEDHGLDSTKLGRRLQPVGRWQGRERGLKSWTHVARGFSLGALSS
jgi:hypothetical protein